MQFQLLSIVCMRSLSVYGHVYDPAMAHVLLQVAGRYHTWGEHRHWLLGQQTNATFVVGDDVIVYTRDGRDTAEGVVRGVNGDKVSVWVRGSNVEGEFERKDVSLGVYGDMPSSLSSRPEGLAEGLVSWRDYVTAHMGGGEEVPLHPPRRFRFLQRVYGRLFSTVLRKDGVEGLLRVCQDLGISVVGVQCRDGRSVGWWQGDEPVGRARQNANKFRDNAPTSNLACRCYMSRDMWPVQPEHTWRQDTGLGEMHDVALSDAEARLRVRQHNPVGKPAGHKRKRMCPCCMCSS